ncbi:uncharacterized protein LOC121862535 [Homarus americanus]|uniref:Uncharacterized protein n=1 Tax=Homarus americanus TaxID=6706 RepID=A0A8J5N243_HOMAM|nr:uncharacterized protein LOC121862535 [Homarus americanus]KAG7171769.1 hypothetical protein Hamer_G000680 [Homarus americanus]
MWLGAPWAWVWAAVWACIWILGTSSPMPQDLAVGVGAKECHHNVATLYCDYKGTDETVVLRGAVDDSIEKVFVVNARRLRVSEDVCVNVMVISVAQVLVERAPDPAFAPCHTHLELSARNSSLDRLPGHVNRVFLEDTNVTQFITTAEIQQLTVINSVIKVVEVSAPLMAGIYAVFLSSNISTLRRLHVNKDSLLEFQKSHISEVAVGGLVIQEGGEVVVQDTTTTSVNEESSVVVLGDGGSLSLKNYTGSLKVTSTTFSTTLQPNQKLLHEALSNCEASVITITYYKQYVTCLVLLLLVLLSAISGAVLYVLRKERNSSHDSSNSEANKIMPHDPVGDTVSNPDSPDDAQMPMLRRVSEDESQHPHHPEEVTRELCSSMQEHKISLQLKLKDLEEQCQAKLKTLEDKRNKRLHEESLINNELLDLEEKYCNEENKQNPNLDITIQLLGALKDNKEVKQKIYTVEYEEEKQEIAYKDKIKKGNKEFMKQLADSVHTALTRWLDSRGSAVTNTQSLDLEAFENLFHHIIKTLQEEITQKTYTSESKDELQKYIKHDQIQNTKEQQDKITNEINTNYQREMIDLHNKTPTKQRFKDTHKLRVIYDIKTELLKSSQSLEHKVLQSVHSENKLELYYLDTTTQLLKHNINELENMFLFGIYILQFYDRMKNRIIVGADENADVTDKTLTPPSSSHNDTTILP